MAFRGDHPSLNAHLADALPGAAAYDLVSTHSKYAPSQAQWLRRLDDPPPGAFHPTAVDLCRAPDGLLCRPRNIDVRLLWLRRDLVGDAPAPDTWDGLLTLAAELPEAHPSVAGFAFPGRSSGLFGTFYELTVAFGGHLFDGDGQPTLDSGGAAAALDWMLDAHRRRRVTPPDLDRWYFDEVAAGLRDGRVAMIGDWPGYYGLLVGQVDRDLLEVARYPSGPGGRAVYAGCHAFALPVGGREPAAAQLLLDHLTSPAAAAIDAAAGVVPARLDVAVAGDHPLDRRRSELLAATIADDLLTFPPLARYPEVEDAAATALAAALFADLDPATALAEAQAAAERALG